MGAVILRWNSWLRKTKKNSTWLRERRNGKQEERKEGMSISQLGSKEMECMACKLEERRFRANEEIPPPLHGIAKSAIFLDLQEFSLLGALMKGGRGMEGRQSQLKKSTLISYLTLKTAHADQSVGRHGFKESNRIKINNTALVYKSQALFPSVIFSFGFYIFKKINKDENFGKFGILTPQICKLSKIVNAKSPRMLVTSEIKELID